MTRIELVKVGEVEESAFQAMLQAVAESLGADVAEALAEPDPVDAWDPGRGQYSSSVVLKRLVERCPAGRRVLGVTGKDLFIPMLSFVYGQAQLDGRGAIVSLARLRQEFYGLPADSGRLIERARKEALHELGHTFGLIHCSGRMCVMALSTNLNQLDVKGETFCGSCRAALSERLRRAGRGREA